MSKLYVYNTFYYLCLICKERDAWLVDVDVDVDVDVGGKPVGANLFRARVI